MKTINDLMEYLRPSRITNETYKHQSIIPITPSFNPNEPYKHQQNISNSEYKTHYLKKNIDLEYTVDGKLTLYVRSGLDEFDYWYYIKRITPTDDEDLIEYRKLSVSDIYGWEILSPTEEDTLTEIPLEPIGTIHIHMTKRHLVYRTLATQVVSGSFLYDPTHLETLENGEDYIMDYVDHEGYGTGTGDTILKFLLDDPIKRFQDTNDRKVKLKFRDESRNVYWYPLLKKGFIFEGYSVAYYYVNYSGEGLYQDSPLGSPNKAIQFNFRNDNLGPKAIELKFKSIYGLLIFLNETILTKRVDLDTEDNPKRYEIEQRFVNSYIDLVSDVYREKRNDTEELFKLFYYLPYKALFEFPKKLLWDFLERAVQSFITNAGTNKEGIVLKIIKTLAEQEKPTDFLDHLIKKQGQSSHILEMLTSALDGDTYTEFVYLVWTVWAKSDFYSLDSKNKVLPKDFNKSPLLIPYKSDTIISFHTDNASIDWVNNYESIKVDIEQPSLTPKELKENIDATVEEVKHLAEAYNKGNFDEEFEKSKEKLAQALGRDNYVYHPFCPVAIVNKNNPKFIFKGGGSDEEFVTIMPAFILLAREERAFWSNLITVSEYIIDLLSFAGGYMAILKGARLISSINAGKSVFLNIVKGGIKQAAGGIFITSGVGRGLLKLTETQDTKLGKLIGEILFYLEIAAMIGEIGVGLHTWIKKAALKAANSKQLGLLKKEAKEVIRKNLDENGVLKRTDDVIEAEEKLAAIKKVEEIAVFDLMRKVSKRGRRLGRRISKSEIKKIEAFLKKRGVQLDFFPQSGSFTIKGYFNQNGKAAIFDKSAAAMFITDGINMKMILREKATIYEFFHEFMHYKHSQKIGLQNYYKMGGKNTPGEFIKEHWVFDKVIEHQDYFTRSEIKHASDYINDKIRYKFGEHPIKLDFDIKLIPEIRQEININEILNKK